jgi:hypothetical protein
MVSRSISRLHPWLTNKTGRKAVIFLVVPATRVFMVSLASYELILGIYPCLLVFNIRVRLYGKSPGILDW